MPLDQHLVQIENAGLVRIAQLEPELEYLFRHALFQEAVYGTLTRESRRALHQQVGEAIEALYSDRLDELAAVLGGHFGEAGDGARALHYLTQAADQAARRYASVEAVEFYRRAIDLIGQVEVNSQQIIDLYLRQGRVQELSGKHEDAMTTYLGLELLARERADRPMELAALMAQGTLYGTMTSQHDPGQASQVAERAVTLAHELNDEPAEAKILWNLSLARWTEQKTPEAVEYAGRSLAIARRLNLREQMAFSLHDLSRFLLLMHRLDEARAAQQEAETLWRELHNLSMLVDSMNVGVQLLYALGDHSGAQAVAEEALRISRETDNSWGQALNLQVLHRIYRDQGEIGRALAAVGDAVDAADQAGFLLSSVFNRAVMVQYHRYLNQPRLARDSVAALQKFPQSNPMISGIVMFASALLALDQGDQGPAQTALKLAETIPRVGASGSPADLYMTELAFRLGDYERVLKIVDRVPLDYSPFLFGSDIAHLLRMQGQALAAQGHPVEARHVLEQAMAILKPAALHFQRWETLAALVALAEAEGDVIAAQQHRTEAGAEVEYLAALIGDAELEASFRARPDIAALLAAQG